jgi:DNA-binding NtrC family response regulator
MTTVLKVLHVDDDPDIITITRMSLALRGPVEVRSADSSEAVFTVIGKDKWAPDLVLLDIRLGTESTVPILKRLREWQPDLPIIVLSGAGPVEHSPYKALRVLGFIAKPFDPLTLYDHILEMLAARDGTR